MTQSEGLTERQDVVRVDTDNDEEADVEIAAEYLYAAAYEN